MDTLRCGIRYRHWPGKGSTRASVLLLHGLGEHSGRYEAVAAEFTQRGFAVYAPDHMGHGESPGKRVFVEDFDDFLPAVRELRALIAETHPEVPCFLLGHSMGGLLAARLLLDDQDHYRGAVLSGPAFAAGQPPSALLLFVGRLIGRLAPGAGLMALDVEAISRDPKVVAAYNNDPLVNHGKVSAGLAVAIFDTMERVNAGAGSIHIPLLVMHGDADTLAAPEGSQKFVEAVAADDKTLTRLPGLYHEIFNEPEGASVIAACADWIEARLS